MRRCACGCAEYREVESLAWARGWRGGLSLKRDASAAGGTVTASLPEVQHLPSHWNQKNFYPGGRGCHQPHSSIAVLCFCPSCVRCQLSSPPLGQSLITYFIKPYRALCAHVFLTSQHVSKDFTEFQAQEFSYDIVHKSLKVKQYQILLYRNYNYIEYPLYLKKKRVIFQLNCFNFKIILDISN